MPRPQESIWGSINTCLEIGIEIYRLFCKTANGENKDGIAIPIDKAKEILPVKALSAGIEKDGFIYFESPDQILIPMFELLKSAAITNDDFIKESGDLESIENSGKVSVPEYFGKFPPPQTSTNATVTEIRNGAYMIKAGQDFQIALHNGLAYHDIGLHAYNMGIEKDDYIVFDRNACAAPLFELSLVYPEINDLIINRESLLQTLIEKYPSYVDYWNYTYASVEEDSVIKANGSIPSMFLQEHYDYEAENVREAVCAFDEISEHEADLDMGFELLDDEWELEI